jgi:indole-3-glycerol phosphate synthase/phosphoribosylanthranilate isomerase
VNIRNEIVEKRRERLCAGGHAQGLILPEKRTFPLVKFGRNPFVICEIKRRSPSKGAIDEKLDPAALAKSYAAAGVLSFSVLTEEDAFNGSLRDLISVKTAFPEAAVLRKDFLLDEEDIEVSYRAGADAVLLIAAVLPGDSIAALSAHAKRLGMEVLVEVHGRDDVEKVRSLRPPLVGINARNLETFEIDLLRPAAIRGLIDWDARVVFESGITDEPAAAFAGSLGFHGILVGEAAVRNPGSVPGLLRGFTAGQKNAKRISGAKGGFWNRIALRSAEKRPLIKICGLTNKEDAELADELGADLIGFVFAESSRRADPAFVRALDESRALKVGVVVLGPGGEVPAAVISLLEEEKLDCLQIHGSGREAPDKGPAPERFASFPFPFFYAARPRNAAEAQELEACCPGPRILLDAYSASAEGGTGLRVSEDILSAARRGSQLWLAGGLGPENIREVVTRWHPELIDASSGLEESPGKKSPEKLRTYFKEAGRGNIQ